MEDTMNAKKNALKLFVGTAAVLKVSFREAPPSAPPPQRGGKGERRGISVPDRPHRLLRQRFLAALNDLIENNCCLDMADVDVDHDRSGTTPQQPSLIEPVHQPRHRRR
jgi:hypothetical protein